MAIDPEELKSNITADKYAPTYSREIEPVYTQRLKLQLIQKVSHPQMRCLDIGIATGLFAIPLAKQVNRIDGIDISQPMIRICKGNIEDAHAYNVHVHEMSATNLGFPDKTFDLAYSFSTLILLEKIEEAVREIHRVLKPGGLAVLDIGGRKNLSYFYWSRYYKKQGQWGISSLSLTEARQLVSKAGFAIEESHSSGFTDQWKYIPMLRKLTWLDRYFHETPDSPDRDYRLSQFLPTFANRWYFVLRKVP